MAALGIELDGDVLHAAALERVDAFENALCHAADGILAAGDEHNGQLLVHLIQIFLLLVHANTCKKVAREANRRVEAAEGVCVIGGDNVV